MDDFAKSLNLADEVFLTQIYSSPRESSGKVSSEDLSKKITKGGRILSADNMSPLLDYDNDVIIFMGAGDIQKYEKTYEDLLSHLSKNNN
jgi:UDP-N-acetylmuramate--alanine ligase